MVYVEHITNIGESHILFYKTSIIKKRIISSCHLWSWATRILNVYVRLIKKWNQNSSIGIGRGLLWSPLSLRLVNKLNIIDNRIIKVHFGERRRRRMDTMWYGGSANNRPHWHFIIVPTASDADQTDFKRSKGPLNCNCDGTPPIMFALSAPSLSRSRSPPFSFRRLLLMFPRTWKNRGAFSNSCWSISKFLPDYTNQSRLRRCDVHQVENYIFHPV